MHLAENIALTLDCRPIHNSFITSGWIGIDFYMDLRQLRTVVTVVEQGTVSKAALRLHIAQPALSRQIKDLEQELGLKLFDRVRRRLVLTGEGEQLLGDCRTVLAAVVVGGVGEEIAGELEDVVEIARRPAPVVAGELRRRRETQPVSEP